MTDLTPTLEFIREYLDYHHYAPSVTDIAEHFGIARSTAWRRVVALQEAGLLVATPGVARSLLPVSGAVMKAPEVTM